MFRHLLEEDAGEWDIKVMHHQNVLAVKFEMQPRSHRSGCLTRTKNDKRLQSSTSVIVPTRSRAKSYEWTENPSGGIKEIKIKTFTFAACIISGGEILISEGLKGDKAPSAPVMTTIHHFKENTFIC